MSDEFYESPIKSLRREKEEAQREGLRLVALLRERDDTLAAVRECYQRHIFDKGWTADLIGPNTLEGEVWQALNRSDTDE